MSDDGLHLVPPPREPDEEPQAGDLDLELRALFAPIRAPSAFRDRLKAELLREAAQPLPLAPSVRPARRFAPPLLALTAHRRAVALASSGLAIAAAILLFLLASGNMTFGRANLLRQNAAGTQPSVTPTRTATPTPAPSATPQPTHGPIVVPATRTAQPTDTATAPPQPMATPRPSATPTLSVVPTPSPTPAPAETAPPTQAPAPTATPKPAPTRRPRRASASATFTPRADTPTTAPALSASPTRSVPTPTMPPIATASPTPRHSVPPSATPTRPAPPTATPTVVVPPSATARHDTATASPTPPSHGEDQGHVQITVPPLHIAPPSTPAATATALVGATTVPQAIETATERATATPASTATPRPRATRTPPPTATRTPQPPTATPPPSATSSATPTAAPTDTATPDAVRIPLAHQQLPPPDPANAALASPLGAAIEVTQTLASSVPASWTLPQVPAILSAYPLTRTAVTTETAYTIAQQMGAVGLLMAPMQRIDGSIISTVQIGAIPYTLTVYAGYGTTWFSLTAMEPTTGRPSAERLPNMAQAWLHAHSLMHDDLRPLGVFDDGLHYGQSVGGAPLLGPTSVVIGFDGSGGLRDLRYEYVAAPRPEPRASLSPVIAVSNWVDGGQGAYSGPDPTTLHGPLALNGISLAYVGIHATTNDYLVPIYVITGTAPTLTSTQPFTLYESALQ